MKSPKESTSGQDTSDITTLDAAQPGSEEKHLQNPGAIVQFPGIPKQVIDYYSQQGLSNNDLQLLFKPRHSLKLDLRPAGRISRDKKRCG